MTSTTNHYTFGETDLAAQRLALLAAVYEPATRAFLDEWGPREPEHALDLGCGPGYTTRLLSHTLRPRQTTGMDASARFLEDARRSAEPGTLFVCHDVTQEPFPTPKVDVFLCRFLLTHLHDPVTALRTWAAAARPGARLLIQETAWLKSDDPVIARYYERVATMQAGYGQNLEIGVDLDARVRCSGWKILSSRLQMLTQPAPAMARLHAMNIRTWGRDHLVQQSFDLAEVASLQAGLDRIASANSLPRPCATPSDSWWRRWIEARISERSARTDRAGNDPHRGHASLRLYFRTRNRTASMR
jgi:trans-aconitate 2-methyltransferase